ncbi:hypothetical protein [Streptomyces sirii]|uniref:hypothetical protein n=1 Tax=Streptomyces sirii TaxID=3127701 RepID=UPI003D35EC30
MEGFSFGSDGGPFTVASNAFTKPVTLKEQKSGYSGTATLRCDIRPGTYAVELAGPDITAHALDHGGRGTVKVYPGDDAACAHPKRRAQAADTHRDTGARAPPSWRPRPQGPPCWVPQPDTPRESPQPVAQNADRVRGAFRFVIDEPRGLGGVEQGDQALVGVVVGHAASAFAVFTVMVRWVRSMAWPQ